MNRLLIVGILIISTAPLYAQRQQQNVAKLKADARNVVGTIANDKAKTKTYCQILDLARQLAQAAAINAPESKVRLDLSREAVIRYA